jgi:predicted nucleic acid-binding protein
VASSPPTVERVFVDANVLFTAAYSPGGLSALLLELGAAGRVEVLTSPLAVIEARRNLEVKRPAAVGVLNRWLSTVTLVQEPAAAVVDRLAPDDLAAKDRPVLAAALAARATHFVTGDRRDFGRWMEDPGALPIRVMTPRQFLTEVPPPPRA